MWSGEEVQVLVKIGSEGHHWLCGVQTNERTVKESLVAFQMCSVEVNQTKGAPSSYVVTHLFR